MQNDMIENFQKMTQQTLESFKKLGETNLRIGEKLLQEQIELTNALLETAAGCASVASESKDFGSIASKQAEWAQETSQKVLESSRTCAEIIAEAGKVYSNLFETGLKAATATTEKAAKARSKAAA